MSRSTAHDVVDMEEFAAAMDGVYSESVIEAVRDEAPMAYQDVDAILEAIEPTAAVIERLDAVDGLSAADRRWLTGSAFRRHVGLD